MWGELDVFDEVQPGCHQGVPILKMDFDRHTWTEETSRQAQGENLRLVADLIQELGNLEEDRAEYIADAARPRLVVDDIDGFVPFETYLAEDFYNSDRFSADLKQLLAQCMAVDINLRPSLRRALRRCEHGALSTPNWRHLADEVNELFDSLPPDRQDNSGSEYGPPSDSDEEMEDV
ncbi:hypothetical protein NUW58_g2701 [Xylaria curta]|uniref:Uncharacterized protein n=1 Tax=Xylaria curta TaxID=42375 RepID=A0ACC1PHI5_9PEZI|nr:hypothetical protein NUW58_g2701 [Xylaria curta]